MSFCPKCGTKIKDGFVFCNHCGAKVPPIKVPLHDPSSAKEVESEDQLPPVLNETFVENTVSAPQEAPAETAPQPTVTPACEQTDTDGTKNPKKPKKAGQGRFLSFVKVATLVLVILVTVAAIATSLYLSLWPEPSLNVVSGEDTTHSDGSLQVSLVYNQDALLFNSSQTARMDLILTNISDDLLRDITLDISLPKGIQYIGTPEAIKVDVLSPGVSYRVSLPVQKQAAIDNNFVLSLIILIAAVLLTPLLLILYGKLCGKLRKQTVRAMAMVLTIALLLPWTVPVVEAASKKSKLVYEDGNDFAIAIATDCEAENTFYLGSSPSSGFTYTARYSCEQRILLDATLSESNDGLVLSWNSVEGADKYRILSGHDPENLTEEGTSEEAAFTLDLPSSGTICYYRVVAETDLGDLYTNILRLMVQDDAILADNDGDLISNEIESAFGTSTLLTDTDGDGLSDYDEIAITFTSPTNFDTDSNGISDGDEDPDNDGLTNVQEIPLNTSPLAPDSDQDGLTDGIEENTFHSNPLLPDSDGDGLWDGTEFELGTDPNKQDSNDDGVSDADSSLSVSLRPANDSTIALRVTDSGEKLSASKVTDITNTTVFAKEEFVASPVVSVEIPETAIDAHITLPIIGNITDDEIVVVAYNEAGNDFRVLENASLSDDGTSITVPVTQDHITPTQNYSDSQQPVQTRRSTYCALYIGNWHQAFQTELTPDRDGNLHFDVSFVIDESSSMEDSSKTTPNDPNRYRVEAAKRFTQALIAGDQAAVVGFNDAARRKINLTSDMDAVRTAIDSIVGNAGGTALYAGLKEALTELTATTDSSRGRFIIALTDGEDSGDAGTSYDEIIATCQQYSIPIYTIGLGSSVNTSLLTRLATYTGGAYIHVASADDLPEVFNRIESTAFYGVDTDGDGLADSVEQHGLRDATGSVFYTDVNDRYTDNDDLSDGEEAGNVFREEQVDDVTVAYYMMLTDPTKTDTDGDGVDDLDETLMKTLPWCADTDGDGLADGQELALGFDPVNANPDGDYYNDSLELQYNNWAEIAEQALVANENGSSSVLLSALISSVGCRDPYTYDLSTAEKGAALLEGALLGDFGDMLAENGILDSRYTNSIYYYLGDTIIGLIPVASAIAAFRDAVACAINGDFVGSLLNVPGILPGGKVAVEVVQKISDVLSLARDAGDAIAEYPSSVTVQTAAAAPAFTYLLLRIFRNMNETYHLGIDLSSVDDMIDQQIELGNQGLTKATLQNWKNFLYYEDRTPYLASTALNTASTLQLTVSNLCTPLDLTSAARIAAGNQQAGVQYTTTDSGAYYKLVRAFDLECTEYQDAFVLEKALHDAVDRLAAYVDPARGDLERRLQILVTDALVSREVHDVLSGIHSYASQKGITLECTLYLTTDDTDYNSTLDNVEKSDYKNAIIILPGISGSELVAGEDYTGSFNSSLKAGDGVWLPVVDELMDIDPRELVEKDNLLTLVTELIDAINALQLDDSGSSLYKLLPKQVQPSDLMVGAMGTGTQMYKALLKAFGPDSDLPESEKRDVIFFSYDWRKSTSVAASDLQTFIQSKGYESVTFVCHSMGGIVCSSYLSRSQSNRDKTEQVITIGTPYGGAPKAAFVFETGEFLDFRISLVDNAFMKIARNLPSVYELLPYNRTISNNGKYLLNGKDKLDAAATNRYLTNSPFNLNQQMLQGALGVENLLYESGSHVMNRDDINCTIIAGMNMRTITTLITDGEKITAAGYSMAGDGTVPLVSAIEADGVLFKNPIYLVDGVSHSGLFSDDQVIDLVKSLLDSDPSTVLGDKISFPDDDVTTSSEIISDQYETTPVTEKSNSTADALYDLVVAYCPVSLSLFDGKGSLVGTVSSDGIFVNNEDDRSLFQLMDGGETKQVIVPQGYALKVDGEDTGIMDLMVATMNSMGEMVQKYMYNDIEVNASSTMEVSISKQHEATLYIDRDGDNNVDQTLEAKDAEHQVYLPMNVGGDRTIKTWILVGTSIALALGTGLALLFITLTDNRKRKRNI